MLQALPNEKRNSTFAWVKMKAFCNSLHMFIGYIIGYIVQRVSDLLYVSL